MPPSDDALAIIAAIEEASSKQYDALVFAICLFIGAFLGYVAIKGLFDPWK